MSKDHGNHIPFENLDLAGHFDIGFHIVKLKIKKNWLLYKYYIPQNTGSENVILRVFLGAHPLFFKALYREKLT